MAAPPPYEKSAAAAPRTDQKSKTKSELSHAFSIRDEVGASRTQHVAALVSKLLPRVRERAQHGLSKSTLLLVPSNQDPGRDGELVGFPVDETPVLIHLEGHQDTSEFWAQQEAIHELKTQLLMAMSDSIPTIVEPLPERPAPPPATKSSFWSRTQKPPGTKAGALKKSGEPPVSVDVRLDEVHFQTETQYGLYETVPGRGILVEVVVR